MEDNQTSNASQPTISEQTLPQEQKSSRGPIIIAAIIAIVILVALILGVIFLARTDLNTTGRIRDIFIIFMALEFLVIGVALIVLMVQLATLINLLQNEVKPILTSTSETVNTLRGTVVFLSNNLTEPVIKLNEYLAGLRTLLNLIRLGRR